jgi:hypothetical protein
LGLFRAPMRGGAELVENGAPPHEPASEGAPLPNLLPAGGEKEPEFERHSEVLGFNAPVLWGKSLSGSLPARGERESELRVNLATQILLTRQRGEMKCLERGGGGAEGDGELAGDLLDVGHLLGFEGQLHRRRGSPSLTNHRQFGLEEL